LRGLCYNTGTMRLSWFRAGLLVICAGLLCAGMARAGAVPQAAAPRPPSAESRAATLLVFPFENGSHIASLDWLGEGLAELTLERLQDKGASVLTRLDRLATLEKMGLPDSARFSHATLVKIAGEADADAVIYGRYTSDGKTVTIEAQVLRIIPPSLSPPFTETAPMQDLLRAHARLAWRILCAIDSGTGAGSRSTSAASAKCPAEGANRDESSFSDPPASLRLDALENLIRGLIGSEDDARIRSLREASRLEPAWDRPPFELGLIYFDRHDCESALPWFSRVPPNRPDGPEASFDTGICHLLRNDAARADAAFSGLLERSRSADPREKLPEFPEVRNNLGIARLLEGKWAEAGAEFERAAVLDPGEPDYLVNQAIAKLAEKQPAAAVAPLEGARKLNPEDKEARALLVPLLESLGRSPDAAAIRAESPATAPRTAPPNLQNPAALARFALPSKKFDRSFLRPPPDPPDAQPAPAKPPAGSENKGERR
jgi:Flp pilus assembly protein TadD/TolB-like protein